MKNYQSEKENLIGQKDTRQTEIFFLGIAAMALELDQGDRSKNHMTVKFLVQEG